MSPEKILQSKFTYKMKTLIRSEWIILVNIYGSAEQPWSGDSE